MRIFFLTSGKHVPSSRFRVAQYVPHLRKLGHICVVSPSHPQKYEYYRWLGWSRSQRLQRLLRYLDLQRVRWGRYDVVFIEREVFHDDTSDFERRLRTISKTLVLDVDDGIFLLHPTKFETVVKLCDGVIAGNSLLRDRIIPLNPRATVIPTCVDVARYPLKEVQIGRARPLVVGWTGTASTLPFLEILLEPLRELARRLPWELRIIAEDDQALTRLDLRGIDVRFLRWREHSEVDDLLNFDVGVMPMPDTEWTRYKCGLKIIQYMAAGIPAVASPVGVNSEIIQNGENGFLADTARQWLEILVRLAEEPNLRRTIGAAGRRRVEEHYSVQAQLPMLVAALDAAALRATRGGRISPSSGGAQSVLG